MDDAQRRNCIVFWAFQDFRSKDLRATFAELERIVLDDPIVQTIICEGDDGEFYKAYDLDIENHTATWRNHDQAPQLHRGQEGQAGTEGGVRE